MKSLPNAEHFVRILVVVSSLVFTASCKQDQEPTPGQATAQFVVPTLAIQENEGEKTISLTFDKPAVEDGQIVLKVNTIVPRTFSTLPAANHDQISLPVFKGQVSVDFKIIPTDNPSLDGCKVVKFTIAFTSEGMQAGSLRDLVVSVNDDEAPVNAGFENEEYRIRENDPAAPGVTIDLGRGAPAEGNLVIQLQSTSKYGVEYTTEPAVVGDKIFLHVAAGQKEVSVRIFPVNDKTFRPDRIINFTMIEATGGVVVGMKNASECIITEDERHTFSPIRPDSF